MKTAAIASLLLINLAFGPLALGSAFADPSTAPTTQPAADSMLTLVKSTIVRQLAVKPEEVTDSTTLESLSADELDLVEIIMELEDELKITIDDAALEKAAGAKEPSKLMKLTPAKLAAIVRSAGAP